MTDSRLSFTARAIILLLGLSLLVMLGVTIKERVSNPHRVTERPTAPQGMGQEQNLLASLMQKVAAEPTNKDALMHLAEHLMATQEWDAAATFAQRAVALDVNDPQPLYMLGVILHNQGKPQEAAATLKRWWPCGTTPRCVTAWACSTATSCSRRTRGAPIGRPASRIRRSRPRCGRPSKTS